MKQIVLLLLCITSFTAKAQRFDLGPPITPSTSHFKFLDSIRYIVTEARINKLDYSIDYFDQGQYLAFYSTKNGESGFLNTTADHSEYSYGQILNLNRVKMEEDGYKGETIYFRWKYRNSYDKDTGYAFVQLKRLYRENGVEFSIKIVSKKLEKIEFSGFTNERKYKSHTLKNRSGYLYQIYL